MEQSSRRRRARPLPPRVVVGVAVTLLALVAAHSARVAHLRQVHRTTEAAAHSLQVTAGLEALLAALAAAESAERGFVITGDAAYLETYEAARSRVAPDIEALRSLTADNPGHQDDIGRLAAAASAKLADVAEVVRRRRESGFTAAQAEVADGPGRRLMDGARAIVARMAAREEAVLASRTRQATDNSRSALLSRYVTSGVAVLALLLLFAGTRAFGAERRRAARARADREHISQQLAAIVESSEDAIVGMDLEGTITAWNPAAERMYGFTADDMIGTAIRRMVPDGRVAEEDRVFERIRRGDRVSHFETVRRRKDGSEFAVSLTISPIRDAGGNVIGISKTARDITDRKQADERFRLAIEAAPTAMMLVDHHGTVVLANALTEKLLGYERDQVIGQSVERFVPAAVRGQHAQHRASFLAHPRQRPMGAGRDLFAVRRDGSEVPVEVGLSPLETAGGFFVLAAVTDITERKAMEAARERALQREQEARGEIERASRMKDEFLAVLSHELRTPLNAVVGYAHLLSTGTLPPDRAAHALAAIERNAQAQARLVESLLDLSRIIAGKLELDLRRLDITKLVETAVDVVRPDADAKEIALDVRMPATDVTLVGDESRLQQVLWNLLSNATKFTPARGGIRVCVSSGRSHVRIEVSDTGRGITPEFLPYVFERFRQADGQTGRSSSGLGLGLAVVRELVQAHGGNIVAESAGDGRGSTFTVMLPVAAAGHRVSLGETPAQLNEAARSLRDVDVLVVDDDGDMRGLLEMLLDSRGATVRSVPSAAEALEAISQRRPDVLLADILMPDRDGYSLIRRVRARERERGTGRVPAIAVTAYAGVSDRERAMAAGYDWYLAKPVDMHELLRVIARFGKTQEV